MGGACGTKGDRRNTYRLCVGDLRERCYLEHVGMFGTILLKRILNKLDGEVCTGLSGLRAGGGGFMECGELFDWLRTGSYSGRTGWLLRENRLATQEEPVSYSGRTG
jgi:hypothetical protein